MTDSALPGSSNLQLSRPRMVFAILALCLGAFSIGVTEFVPMGLLENIAQAFKPTLFAADPSAANAQTGQAITAYALGVVVGAPTIAAVAARLPRRKLLLWLCVAFVVGSIAAAIAPTFGTLLVARFFAGLPHGAYFGIASIVAAEVLGPGKVARASAFVLIGLSIASVVGVPVVTWAGQTFSWRVAFYAVAVLFALTFVSIFFAVPATPIPKDASIRNELRVFKLPQIWLTAAMGAIGFGGFFSVYSYVQPLTTRVTHLPHETVPMLLACTGIFMTAGTLFGGFFADKNLRLAIITGFIALAVVAAFLTAFAGTAVGLFIGVGMIGFVAQWLGPSIQARLVFMSAGRHNIAAALNHSALNIGNSVGAIVGGAVIAMGLGYRAPVAAAILMAILGLLMMIGSLALERRSWPKP